MELPFFEVQLGPVAKHFNSKQHTGLIQGTDPSLPTAGRLLLG